MRAVAFAQRAVPRPSALALVRHLDPGAVVAAVLGLLAIGAGLGHLPPLWTAAIAAAGVLVGNNARRRSQKPRQPTVDHLRSLLLSVLAILLAAAGLAVVAPSLLALAQSRLLD